MGKFETIAQIEEEIKDLIKNEEVRHYEVETWEDEWGDKQRGHIVESYCEPIEEDTKNSIANKIAIYIYNKYKGQK